MIAAVEIFAQKVEAESGFKSVIQRICHIGYGITGTFHVENVSEYPIHEPQDKVPTV